MALANQVIDFVDDIDRTLLKQITEKAPPALMKTAQILTAEERERLDPEQFALIMQSDGNQSLKKFPISDAANTWLSSQYFDKTAEQLPYVAQKIAASFLSKACAIYNLKAPESVTKLASREIHSNQYRESEVFKKTAAPVKHTAVKPDGSEHFFALGENYAMPNPEYVKKAAAYFVDHYKEFEDAEDRHTFAHNVLERAKELQVTVEEKDMLNKFASDQYGDSVEAQLHLRKSLLDYKPQLAEALDKLASHKASTDPETFARALFLFDKKAGLTRYYDRYLSDAFRATFSDFNKTAGYHWEDTTSGLSISEKELTKAASNKYERIKDFFGSTLADSLKKHGSSIFDSLPADAKETIVKIAKGVI